MRIWILEKAFLYYRKRRTHRPTTRLGPALMGYIEFIGTATSQLTPVPLPKCLE